MAEVDIRYRYRLRTNAAQRRALQGVFDACRFCWNQALGRWTDLWHHDGEKLSYREADRELSDWRGRYEWLATQPSVPQQQVLRDLYRSISAFFDKDNPTGRPRAKRKRDGYATARWTRRGFKVSGTGAGHPGDRLVVAVADGRISLRVVWPRPMPSEPSSVTIYRDRAGRWYASFVVKVEVPDARPPTGRSTGIDLGLGRFATTEDPSADIENPRFARRAAKARARSQANMARKAKGSNNRAKARRRHGCLEAKIADKRADFHHKAARSLVGHFDRIGVENLAVKAMSARGKARCKAGLNRSISDAGWAQFLRALVWQSRKAGKEVVVLSASGTTQRCSCCGEKANPRVSLSERVFRCGSCGMVEDRDRNAARNLNPDRVGVASGRAEPAATAVPEGDDGSKTGVPAGTSAA